MYNRLGSVSVAQIAYAMLFAKQVLDLHPGLRIVQTNGVIFSSSDQQVF